MTQGHVTSQHLERHIRFLRCPQSKQPLVAADGMLVADDGSTRYRVRDGIPLFAEDFVSDDARAQQSHYDAVAAAYVANLAYPHTRAYMEYLDRAVRSVVGSAPLGATAEICCGHGEAFGLFGGEVEAGIGVDVSEQMLRRAVAAEHRPQIAYIQGDATRLPLGDEQFDTVFMLGGIHHVNDRATLFAEIFRVLKPGGRFIFREPLNDFLLWRALRFLVYRVSPGLDHATERPLRWTETVPPLEAAGFAVQGWQPVGFLGFCLFMNSDILVFNRLFRYAPGIAALARAATRFDEWALRWGPFQAAGLQVVGVANRSLADR